MNKNRLEAFSDGVLAIIITIMVLEIHVPETASLESLLHIMPTLIGYVLSFAFVGIYWNNHHHLLHTARHVNAAIMWANLNLLFWLSLVPFGTAWMDKSNFASFAVMLYAVLLLLCGVAFDILRRTIVNSLKSDEEMIKVLNTLNFKSVFSVASYLLAIPAAYWDTRISLALFAVVGVAWTLPSRAIEKELEEKK